MELYSIVRHGFKDKKVLQFTRNITKRTMMNIKKKDLNTIYHSPLRLPEYVPETRSQNDVGSSGELPHK